MKSLYLHIGIHKTATTSLQRTLATSRATLFKQGIYYPNYNLIDGSSHYCHHDIARSIGQAPARFTHEQLASFFSAVGRETPANGIAVISSEIFYRLHIQDDIERDAFIRRVRALVEHAGMPITLVITLREQASFIDSLYREHVKQTRYTRDFPRFLNDFTPWLNYRHQIELWKRHFDRIRVLIYEDFQRETLTADFLAKACERRVSPLPAANTNPSLNYDWTLVKRMLNSTALAGQRVEILGARIQRLQNKAGSDKSPNHPRTHFINRQDAQRLFERHLSDNLSVAEAYLGVKSSPFVALEPTPPIQQLVNPHYLRRAINDILSADISDTASDDSGK